MVTDYLQEFDAALEAPKNAQRFINGFMKNRESALKKIIKPFIKFLVKHKVVVKFTK